MPVPLEQRQVDQAPVPGVRYGAQVTPTELGAGVAAVGEHLGAKIYQKSIQEANETAVLDADNQLARASMKIQSDMSQMKGKDAMGASDYLDKEFGKATDTIGQTLSNEQQRQAFQQRATHRSLALQQAAHEHMAKEGDAYQDQVTGDTIKASVDNARLNARNPEVIATEKGSQTLALVYWAQRHGVLDSPQYQQALTQAHSATNTEVIKGLLTDGHDLEAKAYYDQMVGRERASQSFDTHLSPAEEQSFQAWKTQHAPHDSGADYDLRGAFLAGVKPDAQTGHWPDTFKKPNHETFSDESQYARFGRPGHWEGEHFVPPADTAPAPVKPSLQFTAADRDTVGRLLDEGSTRGTAQTKAQEIIASSDGELANAVHKYEGITNPKVQQLTRQLVQQHFADLDLAKKRVLDDNYQAVSNVVDHQIQKNPGVPFIARQVIPPDYWDKLTLAEKGAVQNYIDHSTQNVDQPNNDQKWLTFLDLPTEQKGGLAKRDYDSQYRQHFSKAFQTRADTLWENARHATEKDPKDPNVTDAVSAQHQIFETFRTSGLVNPNIERGKYSDDQVKTVVQFENQATAALEQESRVLKRKLTPIERQTVINGVRDQAIQKIWVPGTFFGTNEKALIQLTEDEKGQALVPLDKIPADELQQLKNYLQSNGKAITADKLRRAYPQWKIFKNKQAFHAIVNE